MRIQEVELRRVRLPLAHPFRAAHGTTTHREALLVRVRGDGAEGWGECAAASAPTYDPEYVDGARLVLREHLVPRLLAGGDLDPLAPMPVLDRVRGHRMARAALSTAVLDAGLQAAGVPLARFLGGVRASVPAGVAVGMADDPGALVDLVASYVEAGYRRVKLKVEPGHDVAPVQAVRARFADLMLQVDANGSYAGADPEDLVALDAFGLALVEQPLAEDDLVGHAALARRLTTPVCLDESIRSLGDLRTVIALGACSVVNVKPGRLGGLLEARSVHDAGVAAGLALWCGGALETGIGRAANVALASLPGFTLPGDLSASDRYFATDLTEPFVLDATGAIAVPTGPGLGVEVRPDVLEQVTLDRELLRP